ncbi:MAG: Ppx/GppA family phosphatase [Desulfobacterales bacterium]|nr:Ppx/GppA family phosphatase [Desulfobacterales bacterium]
MIAAGIDIGTNTFRLLIGEIVGQGIHPLARGLATVRLGQGLANGRIINQEAIKRGITALAGFRGQLDRFQPRTVRACGTAALRQAGNRDEFLDRAQQTLGLPIEIISGDNEARLGLNGVCNALDEPIPGPLLIVDVGGGSSEFIAVHGDRQPLVFSLELGAVALSEEFPAMANPAGEDYQALDRKIDMALEAVLDRLPAEPALIGCGGTVTSLAALDLGMVSYQAERIQGHCLDRARLTALWQRLAGLTVAERCRLPLLGPGRGDIILAGARIYQRLLTRLGVTAMMVSDAGLLEGILLSSAGRNDRSRT